MTSVEPDPYRPPAAELVALPPQDGERLASRSKRLIAAILDDLLYLGMFLPFGVLFVLDEPDDTLAVALVCVSVVLLLGVLALQIALLARNRWTLGKRLLSIRIVRSDGSEASFARVFWLRGCVTFLITSVANGLSLIDALFIFGARRRCLHDFMADTIVVDA